MLTWHFLCYRYEALRMVTIEEALRVMRREVQTGALLFGVRR